MSRASKSLSGVLLGELRKLFDFFPAGRYASAGNSDRNVSVCPSVCLSRAGIVSKRRKLASWFLHRRVAQESSFLTPNFITKF